MGDECCPGWRSVPRPPVFRKQPREVDMKVTTMRLEFREARDEQEFMKLQDVRVRSYRNSHLSGILEDDGKFCKHDSLSFHYGLFEETSRRAVGYLRVTPYSETVSPALPFLEYADSVQIAEVVRGLASRTPLVEATRLSLVPDERAKGWARHLVDSAIAIHKVGAGESSIVICHKSHAAFYRRLGYRIVFEDHPFRVPGDIGGVTLIGPFHTEGSPRLERLTAMSEAFITDGRIGFDENGFVIPKPKIVAMPRRVAAERGWGESTGTWG